MRSVLLRPVGALVPVMILAACTTVPSPAEPPALEGTAWVLASLPGYEPVAGTSITLRFADGKAQGSDGCNRYSVPYTAEGAKLKVSERGMSTQMACPPAVMQQAAAYMSALAAARTWRIEAGQLELLDDGRLLATFTPQPTSLAGTAWKVTGYNNGKGAVTSVLAGSELDIEFSDDGRAAGSAGCNRFNATYTADGAALDFGEAATTRRMCAEPAGVMEQERQFLAALAMVTTAGFEGDRLELRGADGQLALTAVRADTR